MSLSSFGDGVTAVVIGATGGIGAALVEALAADPAVATVIALSRLPPAGESEKIFNGFIDIEDESSVEAAAAEVAGREPAPALVLIATGVLHDGEALQPEKSWRMIRADAMARAFSVNTIGPAVVARHFLPLLPRGRKSVLAALSARVGSIEDNRLGGWIAYRSSKAALNMVIRTLSIELARRNADAIIAGLHPGTVDTGLSRPFQSNVPPARLFTPQRSARALLGVVDKLTPADSGRVFAWDGSPIPY